MNCCKDCIKRHIGCHAKCEDYKMWKEEWLEYKKMRNSKERKYGDYFYHK